ncbi:MAG: glycoside hydrolase family 43 protein [Verrucomicrobiota bacterium JB022]|nr:glycoside hydrolase family 43 protein [Verrucomicrobiota bacterium JB022]
MPQLRLFVSLLVLAVCGCLSSLRAEKPRNYRLDELHMRDASVLADPESQTYYLVSSMFHNAGHRRGVVMAYTSKDLVEWEGPHKLFDTPEEFWPGATMRGIWAPEMHAYKGKYYLFITFNTSTELCEQWREWLPRVRRGSQVLVGDSPLGPFEPFSREPTPPADMMTLDGTLFVEDGVPYMVYCHEWVQIVNGTVEMIRLKDDLSGTVGEPQRLFFGNDGPWAKRIDPYGAWVTDGPTFHHSKSGKLFMLWSGVGEGGYTVGLAISDSGKLAGPWRQQAEPVFAEDGGHAFLFHRFDGQLMMALHQPNSQTERIRLFEMEDTGESLRIVRPFEGKTAK